MINWNMIAQSFFDGFSPLDALIERPLRPGSMDNLIDVNHPNPLMLHFEQSLYDSQETLRRMTAETHAAMMKAATDELRQAVREAGTPRKIAERHGNA